MKLRRQQGSSDPIPIHSRAMQDLSFIRDTIERATTVTSVPGWGGVAMGLTALIAAGVAARQTTRAEWLAVWMAEAVVAFGIGGVTMIRKAEATGSSLRSRTGRLFVNGFVPPMVAGAVLTAAGYYLGLAAILPAVWLLLYGTAVTSAGAFSVRLVPVMGVAFMVLGAIGFAVPARYGDLLMAAGFGGLQIGFGLVIAKRYGG